MVAERLVQVGLRLFVGLIRRVIFRRVVERERHRLAARECGFDGREHVCGREVVHAHHEILANAREEIRELRPAGVGARVQHERDGRRHFIETRAWRRGVGLLRLVSARGEERRERGRVLRRGVAFAVEENLAVKVGLPKLLARFREGQITRGVERAHLFHRIGSAHVDGDVVERGGQVRAQGGDVIGLGRDDDGVLGWRRGSTPAEAGAHRKHACLREGALVFV